MSSTKTFPFFFPFGASTPTGVIIFSFGIPNSLSVYVHFFFFGLGIADFVFCCFGGGALANFDFFEMRELDVGPLAPGLLDDLETLGLLVLGTFVRTVLVGAMA